MVACPPSKRKVPGSIPGGSQRSVVVWRAVYGGLHIKDPHCLSKSVRVLYPAMGSKSGKGQKLSISVSCKTLECATYPAAPGWRTCCGRSGEVSPGE